MVGAGRWGPVVPYALCVLAVYATAPNPSDPLAALAVGDRPQPQPQPGWTTVQVRAASLNHHDLWTLRGVGITPDRFPMILGCDAAGLDEDGNEVVLHGVLSDPGWPGDEVSDPNRSLLSERYPGTFAERVAVPRQNLLPKPAELTTAEAACLGTAWLTGYRMLFARSGLRPGDTVLVQGSSGGVASAVIALARAAGLRVWATGRSEAKRAAALSLGAHAAFESGARLPARVDAVMETVGEATWAHSLRAVRPGGTIVVSGATTGPNPPADLTRVFFREVSVVGSTMGTRADLASLLSFLVTTGVRPAIDSTLPLGRAADGFAKLAAGEVTGKIVFTVS
jgi:NADPH:quinone reductase-like Zn-dependent oxidoreductase